MSYVLALWVQTNETTIVPIEAVGDTRMHTDLERVGKILWMPDTKGKKKPQKNGWTSHDGRVLHISGNKFAVIYSVFVK